MRYAKGLRYAIALTAATALGAMGCSDDNNDNNPDSGVGGRSGGTGGSGGIGGHTGTGGSAGGGATALGTGGAGGKGGAVGTGGAGIGGAAGAAGGLGNGGSGVAGNGGRFGTGGSAGGHGGHAGNGGRGGAAGEAAVGGQAGAATGTGGAAGNAGAAGAAGAGGAGGAMAIVSNGQIVAVLLEANAGEIHTADVADVRANDGDVRTFSMQIRSDHTGAEMRLNALVQSEGFTVGDSPQRQMVANMANDVIDALWMSPTAQFDRQFVQAQIMLHTSVLDLIDNVLLPQTTSGALRTELQTERTAVAMHLATAQTLATALATSSGAGGP